MTSPYRRIRASDAEREEYAQMLRAAMSEGRLTLTDGEERLAKTYAAAFRDELDPLTNDLPGYGRRAMFDTPEFRDKERRHMRRHMGRVASISAILVGIWTVIAIVAGPTFFWPIIPIAFMLFGLSRHRAWHRFSAWQNAQGPGWQRGPWHGAPPWQGGHGGRGWHGGGWHGGGWHGGGWHGGGWHGGRPWQDG
jgi:uncharacterized membrane protein YgcG